MKPIKDESLNNLVCLLASAASDLNGTSPAGCIMDGGRFSTKQIGEIMEEITRRHAADASIVEQPVLKPFIEAISVLPDLSDARAIAKTIRDIEGPEYIVETPKKVVNPNPFAPKR